MSAPGSCQHLIVEGLAAELDGAHAVTGEPRQHFFIDAVRPGGDVQGTDLAALQIFLSDAEAFFLQRDRQRGKTAAKESEFDLRCRQVAERRQPGRDRPADLRF